LGFQHSKDGEGFHGGGEVCAERIFWGGLGKSWSRGREGFSGEVCRRVRTEKKPFLKNQNEKRGGFCEEWQVPNTRECITKLSVISLDFSVKLRKKIKYLTPYQVIREVVRKMCDCIISHLLHTH